MNRRIIAAFVLAGLVGLGGCEDRSRDSSIIYVSPDDAAMNAAIQRARDSVDRFIAALGSPGPSQSGFSVKVKVEDGSEVEHMWLDPVRYRAGVFEGELANDPRDVRNVSTGQTLRVGKDKISDWMYVDRGRLVGGYTVRVLLEAMSPAERRRFEQSLPFTVD